MNTSMNAPDTLERSLGWRDDAACRYEDPVIFDAQTGRLLAIARQICAECPAKVACLEEAMSTERGDHTHRDGTRGGLTTRERADLATRRRQAKRRIPA